MKLIFAMILSVLPLVAVAEVYTIIANPGEDASTCVRLNWHADLDDADAVKCVYTDVADTDWSEADIIVPTIEFCSEFDSVYSRTSDSKDIFERARFMRYTAEICGLQPDKKYAYRIGDGEIRHFKTAPNDGKWTAAIISDFHAYTPLPKRVVAAMAILDMLELCNKGEYDMVLHVGDITAWGGSYSFWKDLYDKPKFKNYMWAGVIGNHDHMSREYRRNTNQYFRLVNNNPENGYNDEIGVCYYFTYDNTLFVMLNNESMRKKEGLDAAQQWVRRVIKENPTKYVVVMEHYQWFDGVNGESSQYLRWKDLFDECGVDIAISGNNHIYARTNALYQGQETDGSIGTVYVQTTSSDDGRGRDFEEFTANGDIIKCRWAEGPHTVSAMLMDVDNEQMVFKLYDRMGKIIDSFSVKAKK